MNAVIARWFYHATISFNAVESPYFIKALEVVRTYGSGYKAFTPYELNRPLLEG